MSVKYVLVSRPNPVKPKEPNKVYAQAKATGIDSLRELSQEIAKRSSINRATTIAVLMALVEKLNEKLADGHIVRLGDFGSFQITVSGEGADSPEKFSNKLIKSSRIVFRPGEDMKQMLASLSFKRY